MSQIKQKTLQITSLCDKILKNPSIEIIDNLNEFLKKADSSFLQSFRDFILLPIVTQIRNYNVNVLNNICEIKTHLIQCITTLFGKTQLNNDLIYKTVLIILLKQILNFNTGTIIFGISGTHIMSIIDCIEIATRRLMPNTLQKLYSEENQGLITQVCYVCVQIIQNKSNPNLRMSAIRCILSMLQLDENTDSKNNMMRTKIFKIVLHTIPDVYTSLIAIAKDNDEPKEKHVRLLVFKALRLITAFVDAYWTHDENITLLTINSKL